MATEAIPETSNSCTRGVASCGHEHRGPPRRGLSIPKCAQNSAKSCSGNQSQESADGEMSPSADRNRHFAEMRAALHMGKRVLGLIETERSVDHRLHPIGRDGIHHRLEVLDRSDGDALQPLLLHDHQGQPRVDDGGPASTPMNAIVPPILVARIDSFSVPTPPTSTMRSTPWPLHSRAFLPQSGVAL